MHVQGTMAKDYWLQDWKKAVKDAIKDHTDNGTPIMFTDWTTKLINGETYYVKDLKKCNATISSTNRGSGGGNGGNCNASGGQQASGGGNYPWKANGEPKEATIHKIDITVLYGNVSKLKEEPWSILPKVTRQWFTDNPQSHARPSSSSSPSPTPTPTPSTSTINPTTTATKRQSSSVKYHQQRLMVLRSRTMSTMTSFPAILILD